ncbi:MAG: MarR family winged helix-turn-helix transcriptional regulator [Propionibacteriaceae bacterium]|jgi:DNA-binding MarR family transcriptional regulator|nr:MarR family winged helix-turn-helix transcriptional regulator [Propionibacteriaceae bacterium]
MPEPTRIKSACHCVNLRRAANAVTQHYDRTLAPAGLTLNQYSLLNNLQRAGELSVTGLARRVGLDRTTLTRNLRPLARRGLVEDRAAPGGRDRIYGVTPGGDQALAVASPLWQKAQDAVEERLSRASLAALEESLWLLEAI